jgi:glycosyltransferase involved in cell wall biosynthesis
MPDVAPAPKISVCVPTYNRAPLLRNFLASILNQTFRDFEVIVADNCSTDETPEIVQAFDDSRLRYVRHDRNIGPFANMNYLIAQARGSYICIVHDDDVYFPAFLERESDMLDRHPAVGMVHCAVYEVDADGRRRQVVRAYPSTVVLHGKDEFVRYLEGHNVCCSSVMARAQLYRDNPFDPRFLCADFLMWMKFALRADVAYIAEPLLEMRVHGDTVTSWLNPMRWHDEFMAIAEEGFTLGTQSYPALAGQRTALFQRAGRAQGKRFLTAGLAAVSRGEFELARGYTAVLEKLQAVGLPRTYSAAVRLLTNEPGRRLLQVIAGVRRSRARRLTQESGAKTARAA